MKGLVLKDLLVLKTAMKTVILIVILFGFMGAMSGSMYMTTFASVYAAILPMTCMAYDERSHFNRYAMVMPVKPRDIALSKYITGLLLAAVAMVMATAIALFVKAPIAETVTTCIVIPVFYHTFMLPLMFKFGTEKSRIIIMVAVVLPAVAIGFAEQAGVLDRLIDTLASINAAAVVTGLVGTLAAMYIASVLISITICKNKEW